MNGRQGGCFNSKQGFVQDTDILYRRIFWGCPGYMASLAADSARKGYHSPMDDLPQIGRGMPTSAGELPHPSTAAFIPPASWFHPLDPHGLWRWRGIFTPVASALYSITVGSRMAFCHTVRGIIHSAESVSHGMDDAEPHIGRSPCPRYTGPGPFAPVLPSCSRHPAGEPASARWP